MLLWTYSKYFMYISVRKLYSVLQGVKWLLDGTYLALLTSRSEKNYHRSAQLLDILFRYKLDLVLEPSGPGNFITSHCGFVSPSYVLQDNVTLYYVTATEAVFVESDEDVDVAHSDNGSFLRVAQFEKARRIVKVPIQAFHSMAEKIGDPDGEIVFVTNTTRCGSTLLSQVFEESGCCIGFSEPDALNAITTFKGKMPQEELDTLIRNCIRMQCKPIRDRPISAYILKPTAPTIHAVPQFIRLFPNSKQLFMYREGLKVAQSLVRTASQMPMLALTLILTKLHPKLTEMSIQAMGLPAEDYNVKLPSPLTFTIFVWCVTCKKYLDLRHEGIRIDGVKYEDLVKRPREATAAIFQYCNLPGELVEKAIQALDKDSQRHSPLSMKNMSKVSTLQLEGEDKVLTDAMCDQMGLPRVPEPCNLEGTITAQDK
jgi:hypothetical protein